jgi:hypothetical protein
VSAGDWVRIVGMVRAHFADLNPRAGKLGRLKADTAARTGRVIPVEILREGALVTVYPFPEELTPGAPTEDELSAWMLAELSR